MTYFHSLAQVDSCYQNRVFDFIIDNIELHYIDSNSVKEIESYFDKRFQKGHVVLDTNYKNFEDSVNNVLFRILKDNHIKFHLQEYDKVTDTSDYHYSSFRHFRFRLSRYIRILKSRSKHSKVKKGKEITISKIERVQSIGYIKIESFLKMDNSQNNAARSSKQACRKVHAADTIIFDLRGNSGGHIGSVNKMLSHFVNTMNDTLVRTTDNFRDTFDFIIPKSRCRNVDVEIYVIIDEETFSAANIFTYYLMTKCNATIIGGKSKGYSQNGNAYGFFLSDTNCTERFDAWLLIPTSRICPSDIYTALSGDGVKPDLKIESNSSLEDIIKMIRK